MSKAKRNGKTVTRRKKEKENKKTENKRKETRVGNSKSTKSAFWKHRTSKASPPLRSLLFISDFTALCLSVSEVEQQDCREL